MREKEPPWRIRVSRIELTEQFYEDEVREGFYIPADVKQAWGAQIRVLNEVDRVCKELGIRYFADWGTFLGAVRHGGFIPWDDDFDICMLRDDYLRFLDEGVKLLPQGYMVYNLKNKEDHEQFVANIVALNRICFEEDHLDKFHGFPYIAAIDVFIIDYVSPDADEQEAMRKRTRYILSISDGIRNGTLKGEALKDRLSDLKEKTGNSVPNGLGDAGIRRFLDMEAEREFASFLYKKDDSTEVVQMMPWGLKEQKTLSRKYYDEIIDLPFETGSIPVPAFYDAVLREKYGDYMFMHKNAGGHDYPFFAKSRAQLQDVLDFDLPEYKVSEDEVLKKAADRKASLNNIAGEGQADDSTYRAVVSECLNEMIRIGNGIDPAGMSYDDITQACADLQQLAIDLGTYMETVKGEGYDIVRLLEKLCEEVYELSTADAGSDMPVDSDKENSAHEIRALLNEIKDTTYRRREVLFLPFKDDYWDSMDPVYRLMEKDPDTDVCVVPIPYYYKDYKHRLKDMQFKTSGYPDDIKLIHYDGYDYKLRHPDVVITQNPYDDVNEELSLPPFFFSDRLLDITDKLVYIPWFKTYDFTRENEREYINMKHYCTVPGVVNADVVMLDSDILRETYIGKLTDFAGERTQKLWEEKIIVRGSDDELKLLGIREDKGPDKVNKTGRKTMVYYPDFSDIMLFGEKAVKKIKTSLDTFLNSVNDLDFIIIKGRFIEDRLKSLKPELYMEYTGLIKASLSEHIRAIDEADADFDELVESCTAYYGDGGRLAHMFRNAGKPVMIQNYEI